MTLLALSFSAVLVLGPVEPAGANEAGATANRANTGIGEWLIAEALHEGFLAGRAEPHDVCLRVLALLEAGSLAEPSNPDAYYWSYDILGRLDRPEAAKAALERYVRIRPADSTAQIRLMELELAGLQAAQARGEFLRDRLAVPGLPREYESALRVRLAQLHFEGRETEFAIREIEKALRLNPLSIPARQIAYELFGETEPALQRVELALQLITANPSQSRVIRELAGFLDQLSLHREAQEWYWRAIDLHTQSDAGPVPAEFWYKLAVSYTHADDYYSARDAAEAVLECNSELLSARLIRAHASTKLGEIESAREDIAFVDRAYQARIPNVERDRLSDEAAEIAWFYCHHLPDKARAIQLATLATESPNAGSLARLALGCALRMNGRDRDAIEILEPLGQVDQLAAVELARAYLGTNQKSRAITLLHKAARLQFSGMGYDRICELLQQYDEIPAGFPGHPRIKEALARFDRRIFDFHSRPGEFLRVSLQFDEGSASVAEPMTVVARLENTGPFAITLGEGYMVRPLISLSTTIKGKHRTAFDDHVRTLLNDRAVLSPGETIERRVCVDVGPVREALLDSIDEATEIEVAGLFDPVIADGVPAAGFGTIKAGPIRIQRAAVDLGAGGSARIESMARSTEAIERMKACDIIGIVLAHRAVKLDASQKERLDAALGSLLADRAWEVRAHAVVAAGRAGLNSQLTPAAAPCVRDDHPIVRMLAVRLFAEHQGEKFATVLEFLNRTDQDRIVRIMARAYADPVAATAVDEHMP